MLHFENVSNHSGTPRKFSVDLEKKSNHLIPDLSNIRLFGCKANAYAAKEIRNSKIAPTSKECIMLGYPSNHKGYRLWCPMLKKVVVCRDAVFFENDLALKPKSIAYLPFFLGWLT